MGVGKVQVDMGKFVGEEVMEVLMRLNWMRAVEGGREGQPTSEREEAVAVEGGVKVQWGADVEQEVVKAIVEVVKVGEEGVSVEVGKPMEGVDLVVLAAATEVVSYWVWVEVNRLCLVEAGLMPE
jgi:hypothetical protein